MKSKIKKTSAFLALFLSSLTSTAFASNSVPFIYDGDYKYQDVGDIKVANCKIIEDSSLDFCTPEISKKLVEFSKMKPNFGPEMQSVLTRFWDKELNTWFYVAVNTTTKVAHAYPRGLRSSYDDSEPTLSFGQADKICTKDVGVDMVGDMSSKSYSDEEGEVDYCSNYSDTSGFTRTYVVDSKTRKPTDDMWF